MTRTRTMACALAALLWLALAGCDCGGGGDGSDSATPGTDSTIPGIDAGTDGSAVTDSGGGATDGGATDGGAGTDGGVGTDASTGGFVISWVSGTIFGNCEPPPLPDPWGIDFNILYDNTMGTAAVTAVITNVRVLFAGGMPVLTLTVTPTDSGVVAAGAMIGVLHTKTGSTPDLPNDCMRCFMDAVIEVELDVGGTPVLVTSPMLPVACGL